MKTATRFLFAFTCLLDTNLPCAMQAWESTPLHALVHNPHITKHKEHLQDTIASLLDDGCDINAKNEHGWTPLKNAIEHGIGTIETFAIAHALIAAGADVTIGHPLEIVIVAVHNHPKEALALARVFLEKGIDPLAPCGTCNALELAYKMRNNEMIALLKQYIKPHSKTQ